MHQLPQLVHLQPPLLCYLDSSLTGAEKGDTLIWGVAAHSVGMSGRFSLILTCTATDFLLHPLTARVCTSAFLNYLHVFLPPPQLSTLAFHNGLQYL